MFLRRKGMVWLVVADGRSARIFSQADRASPLVLVGESTQAEETEPRDRPYRVHDAQGRRHALADGAQLKASQQARFLGSIAGLLNLSAGQDSFEHLILAAPARALGMLRKELDETARKRVRGEFRIDLVRASPAELADWLSKVEPAAGHGPVTAG